MQHTKGRASDLTHYSAILRELVMHGHVTFAELQERYPMMQYEGFLQATKRARRDGIITGPGKRGGLMRPVGCCPACGRKV